MARTGGSVLVVGSANVDFTVAAPHIPAPGETVMGGDLAIAAGGKGANQAVACARAGGAATAMLLALGDDPHAALLERSLGDAGVALHVVRADRPTGAALITVGADGENAIAVAPGANAALRPGDLPGLDGVGWLLMQLEIPIETVVACARAARAAGLGVVLNAAPARALPAALLADLDVLVVNEAELAVVAGEAGTIADRMRRAGAATVVVTLGARGACAWSGEDHIAQPAFAVEAVDTTGAGDAFCGVLTAALAAGAPLADAMRDAAAAGALAATSAGAQPAIPTRAAVAALVADDAPDPARAADLLAYCGLHDPDC